MFPNNYCVSENGEVKNLKTGKILSAAEDKYGYLYYVLCVNGNRKTVKAHRLVALTFIPNCDRKPAVDHINGDKKDNRVGNLRWVTNKENTNNPATKTRFISSVKRQLPKMLERARENRFGRKEVVVMWKTGEKKLYQSLKEASEGTGKSCSKLSEILNGKRKQDGRFTAVWASEIEEFPIAVTKRGFPE